MKDSSKLESTNESKNKCQNCSRDFTTKIGLKLHLRKCKVVVIEEKQEINETLNYELEEVKKELFNIKQELLEVKSYIEIFNIINSVSNFSYRNDINSSFYIKYISEKIK
jgi:hypothetical protein